MAGYKVIVCDKCNKEEIVPEICSCEILDLHFDETTGDFVSSKMTLCSECFNLS